MIRTLFIIAGAAFVLALASAAGALALGGRDLARHGWNWTFHDGDGDSVSFIRTDGRDAGPEASRTLAWSGGERLILDLPYDVEYVQGSTSGISVTGPSDRVDLIRLEGDRLTADRPAGPTHERVYFGRHRDGRGVWVDGDDLRIVVTAPSVARFVLNGSSDLRIRDYDRPELAIEINGSGDVRADGRTQRLTLTGSGSGDAELQALDAEQVMATLDGSGGARIAPRASADLTLSGSGDIELTTRPGSLRQSVTGSGEVHQD
ncbi:GIN domain-containing protein [Brevundimonas sp. VNH65]|uniref:GIN domain-containing protein n=1 Tax=Brevundimonas sp. VNH65 TaxID=3400917 RepID=UPI003C0458DB